MPTPRPTPPADAPVALLRIYTHERARLGHAALHDALVRRARDEGLAGATVLRAVSGFGAGRSLHNAGILDLADDLPLVVEIVDAEERLRAFVAGLELGPAVQLVTLQPVEVLHRAEEKGR